MPSIFNTDPMARTPQKDFDTFIQHLTTRSLPGLMDMMMNYQNKMAGSYNSDSPGGGGIGSINSFLDQAADLAAKRAAERGAYAAQLASTNMGNRAAGRGLQSVIPGQQLSGPEYEWRQRYMSESEPARAAEISGIYSNVLGKKADLQGMMAQLQMQANLAKQARQQQMMLSMMPNIGQLISSGMGMFGQGGSSQGSGGGGGMMGNPYFTKEEEKKDENPMWGFGTYPSASNGQQQTPVSSPTYIQPPWRT